MSISRPLSISCVDVTTAFNDNVNLNANVSVNGNVNIGDICYEGGIRLWHPDKTLARARIIVNPHPIESGSEIELDIPEQGNFTLHAYSPIGVKYPIASGFTLPGKIKAVFPFDTFSSGMYTLVLETPTESVSLPIILNK